MAAVPTRTRLENLRDGLVVFDRVDLAGTGQRFVARTQNPPGQTGPSRPVITVPRGPDRGTLG